MEEIYNFSKQSYKIRIRDIADKLNVSSPSVVKGLKKLESEGYIIYEKYKDILLTDKGEKEGKRLVKRNTILKNFIVMINGDCDPLIEAEACEHYLSPSTIKAFESLSQFFVEFPEIFKFYQDYQSKRNIIQKRFK